MQNQKNKSTAHSRGSDVKNQKPKIQNTPLIAFVHSHLLLHVKIAMVMLLGYSSLWSSPPMSSHRPWKTTSNAQPSALKDYLQWEAACPEGTLPTSLLPLKTTSNEQPPALEDHLKWAATCLWRPPIMSSHPPLEDHLRWAAACL